jgi:DNA-binding transcriptional ArsR family regulator
MAEDKRARRVDARSLRGLAHPLRVRILGLLRTEGPATGATLARRLDEDRGNISWHLKQLAEHGFIAEDADRGTKRERWWRAVHEHTNLDPADFTDDPAAGEPLAAYLRGILELDFRRASSYRPGDWSTDWQWATDFTAWRLRLTPDRLRAAMDEIIAVVDRYGPAEDPQAEQVFVQVQAFPQRGGP